MEEFPRASGRAKLVAGGATALVFAIVGTILTMMSELAQPEAERSAGDALGYLILFIANFFGMWITVLLILLVHRFFLGFFSRAMPPRFVPTTNGDEPEETQPPPGPSVTGK